MKTLRKLLIVVVPLILIFSCSKNESVETVPKETIALEDGLDIDYEDLTVVTIDGEGDVDENGGFDLNTTSTTSEELPILFTKGNDIIFGYYSKTGENNTVSIDDILLFYFTAHPEVAIQGLSNTALINKIRGHANYNELSSQLKLSLEKGASPYSNQSFIDLLNQSGLSIVQDSRGYKNSNIKGNGIDEYEINFSRDGKITWNKTFPLFATVGLEIVNLEGVEKEQFLLEPSGLIVSPEAALWWVYNYLKSDSEDYFESYQLSSEGTYKITFSNGVDGIGTESLESKVDFQNRFILGAQIISIALPIGLKKWLKNDECKQELVKLFFNLNKEEISLVAIDKFELEKFIKGLHDDIYGVVKKCIVKAKWSYFDKIVKVGDPFSKVQNGTELVYNIRDYILSDIHGEETRYYYGGYSYGGMTSTNITNGVPEEKIEFTGEEGSEHLMKLLITEDKSKYLLDSDVNRVVSKITEETYQKVVEGFPFRAERISGNAEQITNMSTIATNSEGHLEMNFKMGSEDSEFEVKPSIEGKGLPNVEIVNLKNNCLRPQIISVTKGCVDPVNLHEYWEFFVEFDTGETGEDLLGMPYSVGLEFQQVGTEGPYQFAFNSYSTTLYSGDKYKGVFRIYMRSGPWLYCNPTGERDTLQYWHNFRVYIENNTCDYKSNYVYFDSPYY